jgi:hypothetical protein
MQNDSRRHALTICVLLSCLDAGLWTSPAVASEELTIARDGKTPYVVVQPDQATEPEMLAIHELTEFLRRVTGATFPVVKESAHSGNTPGIFIGWTKQATALGIDCAKSAEEEWIVRNAGKNLILTGGRPRGTLYAVYEFLENQVGCHWLDRDTEIIPSRPTLVLADLKIQGKPTFWKRELYLAYNQFLPTAEMAERQKMFLVRNKGNAIVWPDGGFYETNGSPGPCHTFGNYINGPEWFDTHPEYFSLNTKGQRVPSKNGSGPGQLCLTNTDVRRIVLEKLRAFIAKDRAEAAKKGCLPPRVYDISQNDMHEHCQCANCQAIVAREGGESGPMIDFINAIAEGIERDYPDILVQTFAYVKTEKPPKTLKPRRNVMIRWCDVYSLVDCVRPLNHPCNTKNRSEITGWGKIASHIAVWDYWLAFGLYDFPTPYCMIQCLGPDLKLFADNHAETMFCESEVAWEPGENFIALRHWLGHRLMVDPYQPDEPLIRLFMDGYYGRAAEKMNAYLKYLQDRIDKEAGFLLTRNAPHTLKYLDLDFFVASERIFDEAEKFVKPGSLVALHLQRERWVVDAALLYLWPWLEKKLPAESKMPFDHETLVGRFETYSKAQSKAFFSEPLQAQREANTNRLASLFRNPKLPEPFRNLPSRDVADFNRLTFSPHAPTQTYVDDKDAAGEMAVVFISDDASHKKPLFFGATGGPTVALKPDEIPQDQKYHVFKIGRIEVKPGTVVWAVEGEKLGVTVDRLFVPNAQDDKANQWDAYISLKMTGPAYIKGSTEANRIWLDRVLLVKPKENGTIR